MARPRRQHIITKALIKQWADDSGKVGVVCLYHRASVKIGWSNAEFWVRRQAAYDLAQARRHEDRIVVGATDVRLEARAGRAAPEWSGRGQPVWRSPSSGSAGGGGSGRGEKLSGPIRWSSTLASRSPTPAIS